MWSLALVSLLAAAPEECGARVQVIGPPEVVAVMQSELQKRSVGPVAPGCSAAVVAVEPSGARWSVVLTDGRGRTTRRTLTTLEIGALWVSSRLRLDLSRPLLAGARTASEAAKSPPEVPADESPNAGQVATARDRGDADTDVAGSKPGSNRVGPLGPELPAGADRTLPRSSPSGARGARAAPLAVESAEPAPHEPPSAGADGRPHGRPHPSPGGHSMQPGLQDPAPAGTQVGPAQANLPSDRGVSGPSAIDAPAGTHRSDSGSALIAIGAAAADSARSNGIHGGAAAARPDASQANAPEAIAGAELDPTPDIPLLPAAVANATSVAQPQNEVAAAPRVPRRPAALAPTAGRGAVALVAPEPSQLWLTTHAELGLGDEGGVFWGAAVTVGTRLGAARPGLRIRGATGRRQPNPLQSNAARTGFELLASIDLPLEAGAFVIAPGVGAGAGWMRSVRLNEEAAICDSPFRGSSECSTTTPIVRDGFAPSTWAPRLEIYTSAMWQAKADWGLELVLSATYTPFAQSGELAPEYAVKLDPAERARMSLAGEPNVVFRGALGLRWGGP